MTVVEPVLEVSLKGRARADLWQQKLAGQGLSVQSDGGSVEVVLSAVEARYMGVLFRELSMSVRTGEDSFYLAHAFNSNRFFAFTEQRFFRAPYYYAEVDVTPRRIAVREGHRTLIEAVLPESVSVDENTDECVEWQVWLPQSLRQEPDIPHFFHARLEGMTEYYQTPSASVKFFSESGNDTLNLLLDSAFELQDWLVRPSAKHSKSKTMDAK